jgi:hypothetical protein
LKEPTDYRPACNSYPSQERGSIFLEGEYTSTSSIVDLRN